MGPIDLDAELQKVRTWVMLSRRSPETQLVTKGHVLKPPFSVACQITGKTMFVTISGKGDKATFTCNRVIASKYRPNQLGLFLVNADNVVVERRFIASLTGLFQRILAAFPPGSKFSSEELYAKVKRIDGQSQSHARRRWKELKYEYGFDVDTSEDRSSYWRGPSKVPIKDPFPRPDDKKLQEDVLPILAAVQGKKSDEVLECNRCGAAVIFLKAKANDSGLDDFLLPEPLPISSTTAQGEGVQRGLLDHRRPVFQGDGEERTNLQIFCETCNNFKANICNKCPYGYRCDTCIWAFPETVRSRRIVLVLPDQIVEKLRKRFGKDLDKRVSDFLTKLD